MAAAALSSSRGVAGGLYILFTLLCLVCLASSRIDDDKLKVIKENNQKIQQNLDNVKVKRAALSEFVSEQMSFFEKVSDQSPDDFLPLKETLEKFKTFIDYQNELLDAEMADNELNLGRDKACIRALEMYQAE
ncbi:hypothetical protein VZT92_016971 [Zoarces viviparus]|uniref:Uncharacterized protein n=1 Tax=Zoarces viviparus TaxID=48416 RepID=A0AAW1EQC9_ZOAVI